MPRKTKKSNITVKAKKNRHKSVSGSEFQTLLKNNSDGIVVIDNNKTVLYANPAGTALLKKGKQSIIGKKVNLPIEPGKLTEAKITCKNGKKIVVEIHSAPSKWKGKPAVLSCLRDITARNVSQQELYERTERYHLAFQGSKDGLWDWDMKKNKLFFSAQWRAMLGLDAEGTEGSPDDWFDRIHDRDIENLKLNLYSHLNGKTSHFEHEYRILHENFTYRWMLCRGTAIRDSSGKPVRIVGSQIDITERKNDEEHLNKALGDLKFALACEKVLLEELDNKNKELTELSITDGLTQLYNHRFLQERFDFEFKRARRYGSPLSCIIMDIDHFKTVNDTCGHQFGDFVLKEISHILKTQIREVDICGRYGGEEFMVLLNLDLVDSLQFAHRIHKAIETHEFEEKGQSMPVTISIGIAEYRDDVKTKQELIERADRALYQAKREGRNRVHKWKEKDSREDRSIDQFGIEDLKTQFTDLSNKMRATYMESTNALVNAIDAKDHYTREHSQNVARYAEMIAQAMKISARHIETIKNAALLHDVGKIGISQDVLVKKGRLTDEEFDILKKHTIIGVNILKDVKFLEKEIPIILHHHERIDGNGYPHGLKDREIPFGARILAVADVYDAMTTERVYQGKFSKEDAIAELKKCSGTQFEPHIVDVFIKLLNNTNREKS